MKGRIVGWMLGLGIWGLVGCAGGGAVGLPTPSPARPTATPTAAPIAAWTPSPPPATPSPMPSPTAMWTPTPRPRAALYNFVLPG